MNRIRIKNDQTHSAQVCQYTGQKKKLPSSAATCRLPAHLNLHVCVGQVVLRRIFPIIIDEVVENRWTEHWLAKPTQTFGNVKLKKRLSTKSLADKISKFAFTFCDEPSIVLNGTCVSKKMTLSCVMKKSIPELW